MSHENPKLLLSQAVTATEKDQAIKKAIELGMPLHEVEEYLDWLDLNRLSNQGSATQRGTTQRNSDSGRQ